MNNKFSDSDEKNKELNFYCLNNEGDVINLKENPDEIFILHSLTKLENLQEAIICQLLGVSSMKELEESTHHDFKPRKKWITSGINCEILQVGSSSWKKGKVRVKVTVEFCHDEPEIQEPASPLDDIRQAINQ